jgi:hypothetical protein
MGDDRSRDACGTVRSGDLSGGVTSQREVTACKRLSTGGSQPDGVPNGICSYLESQLPLGDAIVVFPVPALRGRSGCNIRRIEDLPVAERLEAAFS